MKKKQKQTHKKKKPKTKQNKNKIRDTIVPSWRAFDLLNNQQTSVFPASNAKTNMKIESQIELLKPIKVLIWP